MEKKTYIAVIGDLVASREMDPSRRNDLQGKLTTLFDSGRSEMTTGMASRPLMTLGDEFQVLYTSDAEGAEGALAFLTAVLEQARPAEVRIGIGIGPLSTALRELALGIDGPCFHRARGALEKSRRKGMPCLLDSGGGPVDGMWSMLASYALRQRHSWSDLQREAIELYKRAGAWNKVAGQLAISNAAVTLRHQAAGWSMYTMAWNALKAGLLHIMSIMEEPGEGS